ncbi:MAG: DegV family protein [Oribacterium parvum]|jgi:DegV family protein|uniref:DegV family protein n=1 Tax=Oribacterium parvum TaxID=1501329 RepID=A0A930GY40_9FIRM|nr:DegV family protein [Oribacterium parvum]
MSYQIIADSCGDFTEEMHKNSVFRSVPLTLEIGSYSILDDEHFDQLDFLKRVKESPVGPKTACPSPEAFQKAIEDSDAEEVYIVTLSAKLSGTFQAATIGQSLYEENAGEEKKKVHIFNSNSASAGECKLCMEIQELKEAGKSFEEVISLIEKECSEITTLFVLESLDTLRKNGRLTGVKSFLASALNIKPVMGAVDGAIVQFGQQRGMQKALKKMVELAVEKAGGVDAVKNKRLVITHVNDPERAEQVKADFEKAAKFRDIVITNARGVATIYANDKGIIVAL